MGMCFLNNAPPCIISMGIISSQGGNRPINSSIEDSDEEFDPLNMPPDNELEKVSVPQPLLYHINLSLSIMEQAFQQYQEISFTNQFMDEFGADDDLEPAPMSYSATYGNITSISCTIDANEEHTQAMAGFDAAYADKIHQFDDESESEDVSALEAVYLLNPNIVTPSRCTQICNTL